MTNLAPVLQGFFTQRLAQRRASPATVANYRDTYRLLLKFASQRAGKAPSKLALADLDATLVCAFLDHLETCRANSPATRNTRLIAIRSLFSHAALSCPEDAETIRRVLAIPNKRTDTPIVSYLTRAETDSLLASPDRHTPLGRRDHALLLVAVQTGLRVSELTSGVCSDIAFGTGANIHTNGKGRRQRCTPLLPGTAKLLQTWLRQRRAGPEDPVFPARTGGHLSTDAVKDLLDKHVRHATTACPSLAAKHVTPHTLRHTCAMHLLQSGVDVATIALWLGHASTQATQAYLHADLQLKEQALLRTSPTPQGANRYKPTDNLLAYLESL
jgi:integrase/recombinase XerD